MDALTGLNAAESKQLEQRLQKKQMKEFVSTFGDLVNGCFAACIDDFTSKAVSTRETGCVQRCVQKSMATSQRLSERFQEYNAEMAAKAQQ